MKKILFVVTLALVLVVGFSCSKKESTTPGTDTSSAAPSAGDQANAEKVTFMLNVVVEPENAGSVAPANGAFDKGAAIELKATPNAGFAFDRWEGDVVGTTDVAKLVMDANKNVKAIFKKADGSAAAPSAGSAPAGTTDTTSTAPSAGSAAAPSGATAPSAAGSAPSSAAQ